MVLHESSQQAQPWKQLASTEEALNALQGEDSPFHGHHVLVKGPRAERFERLTDALVQRGHTTRLVLDLEALTHNLQQLRRYIRAQCPSGTDLIGVIKASGYGTHAAAIARVLGVSSRALGGGRLHRRREWNCVRTASPAASSS